jgi:hypothetical protein
MPLFPDNPHDGEAPGFLGCLKIWVNTQNDVWISRTIMVQGLIHAAVILLDSTSVLATQLIGMARAIAGLRYRKRFAREFFGFEYETTSMKYAL